MPDRVEVREVVARVEFQESTNAPFRVEFRESGPPGLTGDKGDKGDKGDQGDRGLRGFKGDKGDQGDPGLDSTVPGPPGEDGAPGVKGDKGDKGDQGDPGVDGEDGLPGEDGTPGVDGEDGAPGVKGDKGDQGDKGDKGDQGDPGTPADETRTTALEAAVVTINTALPSKADLAGGYVPVGEIAPAIARVTQIGDAIVAHVGAPDPHGDRAYTDTRLAALVNSAPVLLDTLGEIAAQIAADESGFAALVTTVGTKVTKTGDTMTGNLRVNARIGLNADPNTSLGNAAKPAGTGGGTLPLKAAVVVMAGGDDDAGLVIKAPSTTWAAGNHANYGTDPFVILADDSAGTDVLGGTMRFHISRYGDDGRTGWTHIATGLNGAYTGSGYTPTQAVWVQPQLDIPGVVITRPASGTKSQLFVGSSTGTMLAQIDSTGNIQSAAAIAANTATSLQVAIGTVNTLPGIAFGNANDAGLYRIGANQIGSNSDLVARYTAATQVVTGSYFGAAGVMFGPAIDAYLFRSAAAELTTAKMVFAASTASQVPIVAKMAASHTANIQEWQDSAGVVKASVTNTAGIKSAGFIDNGSGYVGVTGITPHNMMPAYWAAATPLVIKGFASQTSNLTEWQDSAGLVRAYVGADGSIKIGNNAQSWTPTFVVESRGVAPLVSASHGSLGNSARFTHGDHSLYPYSHIISGATNAPTNPKTQVLLVQASRAAETPIVQKAAASQTADIEQWQDSTGAVLARIGPTGRIVKGTVTTVAADLDVRTTTASQAHFVATDTIDGMYLTGLAGASYMSTGNHWNGSAWIADTTSATSIVGLSNANFAFFVNPANTVGGGVTPVQKFGIDSGGHTGIGGSQVATTGLTIFNPAASDIGEVIKSAASQTANLQEWQNSSGTALASVSSTGTVVCTTVGVTAGGLLGVGGVASGIAFTTLYGGSAGFPVLEVIGTASNNAPQTLIKAGASQTGPSLSLYSSAGAEVISFSAAGLPKWTAAANQQTTVGAAGGASALPATPTKYLKVVDSAGTTLVIPAYAAA